MRPPPAKKARITAAHELSPSGSSPTLKVRQLPSPTNGKLLARRRNGAGEQPARPARAQSGGKAAAAPAAANEASKCATIDHCRRPMLRPRPILSAARPIGTGQLLTRQIGFFAYKAALSRLSHRLHRAFLRGRVDRFLDRQIGEVVAAAVGGGRPAPALRPRALAAAARCRRRSRFGSNRSGSRPPRSNRARARTGGRRRPAG